MRINIALAADNRKQAEVLRKSYFPGTTASETRDGFVFNFCLDSFKNDDLEILKKYLKQDENTEVVQKMLTIKADSQARLRTIAASLGASIAATYRSIIAYSLDNLDKSDTDEPEIKESENLLLLRQMVIEKVALLEKQLDVCNRTVSEIKELLADKSFVYGGEIKEEDIVQQGVGYGPDYGQRRKDGDHTIFSFPGTGSGIFYLHRFVNNNEHYSAVYSGHREYLISKEENEKEMLAYFLRNRDRYLDSGKKVACNESWKVNLPKDDLKK